MERKINSVFEFKGHKFKVIKSDFATCFGCDLVNYCNGEFANLTKGLDFQGKCSSLRRSDKNNVKFKFVS